jgi:hypothetical protein
MALNSSMMSSKKADWETPQELFERLDAVFHFQLDAAASAANTKCARFFDERNSCFLQPWTPGPGLVKSAVRRRVCRLRQTRPGRIRAQ